MWEEQGRKIFVSYKYADNSVANIGGWNSTVRDYVNYFEQKLNNSDHIQKFERDDEDLSCLKEDVIWEKLRNRIYDSSITIIFISPKMKERCKKERDQWIPREISYSLKETSRINSKGEPVTSRTNAMLAVVLPDVNNSYSYYLEERNCCCVHPCIKHNNEILFSIIENNMFNAKEKITAYCDRGDINVWNNAEPSYIKVVKWQDFINNYDVYIKKAYEIRDNIEQYEIHKEV